MPPDIGRTDILVDPEHQGNVAVGVFAVFGNQAQRNTHVLFHLFLQRAEHQVQLARLKGIAGLLRLPLSQMGKLQRLPGQHPVPEPEGVPLPPGLVPCDHLLRGIKQLLQKDECISRTGGNLFILAPLEDGQQVQFDLAFVCKSADVIAAALRVLVHVLPVQPGVTSRFHRNEACSAGGHRRH